MVWFFSLSRCCLVMGCVRSECCVSSLWFMFYVGSWLAYCLSSCDLSFSIAVSLSLCGCLFFFFSSRRRLTRCALVTGVRRVLFRSAGGGVFDRKAKSIALTPQIRALLGIDRDVLTPNELIAALFEAPVDLLWFGGIGTYVKASDESHAEVGDKANDSLRVDGRRVRARVIGEGANLAVTQRGRIEYALTAGGRLNTDFIDNSAGVDCSDHEVNIKVLLNDVVGAGDMTLKQRNELLEQMTGEVAELVLRDNYLQTQALSVSMAEAPELLDQQARFMRTLEKAGRLDRTIEMLPGDEELTERLGRREGLTRPELAVLLSYSKITLYDVLLAGDLPDDPALAHDLYLYFPEPLRKKLRHAIDQHALKREIIATFVTNSLINRTGPTFVAETMDKTGMGASDIARAYLIVRDSFDLRGLWARIDRSEEHTSELQSLMRISYAAFCSKKKTQAHSNPPPPSSILSSSNYSLSSLPP